jgi:phosphate:Na+ symporter
LSEKLYISPAVAVAETNKAVAAMGNIVKENFKRGCMQLMDYNEDLVSIIDQEENELDLFADSSSKFMIGLSKYVETELDNRKIEMLLQTVPSFERIGDYATNFMELGESLKKDGAAFSEMAMKELKLLTTAVNEIISITVDALLSNDVEKAETIEPLEETIDDNCTFEADDKYTEEEGDLMVSYNDFVTSVKACEDEKLVMTYHSVKKGDLYFSIFKDQINYLIFNGHN